MKKGHDNMSDNQNNPLGDSGVTGDESHPVNSTTPEYNKYPETSGDTQEDTSVAEPVAEPAAEPVAEYAPEPVAEPLAEPVEQVETTTNTSEDYAYPSLSEVRTTDDSVEGVEIRENYAPSEEVESVAYPEAVKAEFSLGKALKTGWDHTWKTAGVWFAAIPVMLFILSIVAAAALLLAILAIGGMASEQGAGLESGNIMPFIMLALTMTLIVSPASALVMSTMNNAAVQTVLKNGISMSDTWRSNNGFLRIVGYTMLTMLAPLLFIVTLSTYNTGMSIVHTDYNSALVSLIMLFVNVIVMPYFFYVALNIVFKDKYSTIRGIPFQQTWSIIKKNYLKLILCEIVFGIIICLGMLVLFVGVFVSIAIVTIARAYLFKALVEEDENDLVARDIQEV